MSYEFYARPPGDGVDERTAIDLLGKHLPAGDRDSQVSVDKYLQRVHGAGGGVSGEHSSLAQYVGQQLGTLRDLGLLYATVPSRYSFPAGSAFLRFEFQLAKPYLSRDDDPFYVAKSVNPLRKSKEFTVPIISASGWKGLLRWIAMHVRLASRVADLTPEQFAEERFTQALLFGYEKGAMPGEPRGLAPYLDCLNEGAKPLYEQQLRTYYGSSESEGPPRHRGHLSFYPTCFDDIDVEVINPHSRETKAGKMPIYLECVPSGARGTFALLYVPFDLFGAPRGSVRQRMAIALLLIAQCVRDLLLTYGFSAKRTSGYGLACDDLPPGQRGTLFLRWPPEGPRPDRLWQSHSFDRISQLPSLVEGGFDG